MLLANNSRSPRIAIEAGPHLLAEAAEAIWFDLVNPTEQEQGAVERVTGLRVPMRSEIAEIESSSRLSQRGDALYLSTPMAYRTREDLPAIAPLGFVLSRTHLITVRFADMPVFDAFAERFNGASPATSSAAFIGLLEAMVDRLADVLEMAGSELETISHSIFRLAPAEEKNAGLIDRRLRGTLRAIGAVGERLANVRDSLVGLQRVATYVGEMGGWLEQGEVRRCTTLRKDIASLMEYDVQLSNKVQFLLDATLGFINIEQNNGIKVLTVVSVVGVPPTLVASIYGMNFKWIPELEWPYGYFYGLGMIVLSALLPLIWFRKRGWV